MSFVHLYLAFHLSAFLPSLFSSLIFPFWFLYVTLWFSPHYHFSISLPHTRIHSHSHAHTRYIYSLRLHLAFLFSPLISHAFHCFVERRWGKSIYRWCPFVYCFAFPLLIFICLWKRLFWTWIFQCSPKFFLPENIISLSLPKVKPNAILGGWIIQRKK